MLVSSAQFSFFTMARHQPSPTQRMRIQVLRAEGYSLGRVCLTDSPSWDSWNRGEGRFASFKDEHLANFKSAQRESQGRKWTPIKVDWKASAACHSVQQEKLQVDTKRDHQRTGCVESSSSSSSSSVFRASHFEVVADNTPPQSWPAMACLFKKATHFKNKQSKASGMGKVACWLELWEVEKGYFLWWICGSFVGKQKAIWATVIHFLFTFSGQLEPQCRSKTTHQLCHLEVELQFTFGEL